MLRHARALIEESTHCTRGALSEAAGQSCGHNEKACRWCALAAIIRVAYNLVGDQERAEGISDEVIAARPRKLAWINGKNGHAKLFADARAK